MRLSLVVAPTRVLFSLPVQADLVEGEAVQRLGGV